MREEERREKPTQKSERGREKKTERRMEGREREEVTEEGLRERDRGRGEIRGEEERHGWREIGGGDAGTKRGVHREEVGGREK